MCFNGFSAEDGFTMRGASNGAIASTQTIERLEKSRVVQDYLRLLLGTTRFDSTLQQTSTWGRSGRFGGPDKRFGSSHQSQNQDFLITYVNSKYECCETLAFCYGYIRDRLGVDFSPERWTV